MAYQLPDGTVIRAPRKGRSFIIDGIRHPEKCLESGGFCSAWGITLVPDPVPPPPSPEVVAKQELDARQNARLLTLQNAVMDQFDMILSIFRVGREKGLWTVADFPAELVTKAQEWQQIILDYRSEL